MSVKFSAVAAAGAISGANTVLGVQAGTTDVQYTVTNLATFFWASPTLVTPVLGVATGTSLALGGATIGSNALAVTGTTLLGSQLTHGTGPAILTSPAAATTMLGAATSATAAVAQTLTVSGSSGNSAAAALFTIAGSDQVGTGTTGGELRLRAGNGVTVGGIISFYTSATTTPARAMVINTNGYVGIGIAAPTSASLTIRNDTVDPVQWGSSSTNVGVLSYSGAAGAETSVSMGAITNIPLNLRVNNATRFTISASAGVIQHGAADVDTNAAIVAQVVRSQGALAGGTADQAGKDFTVAVSPGKGTGVGGDFVIQTAPAGSTGTAVNALAEAVRFLATGNIKFTNAANFSANGVVLTSLTGVGPTGAQTTVQEWLTIKNSSGTTRYIPCF